MNRPYSQILSILLPTTFDRRSTFYPLLEYILSQINASGFSDKIEILIDEDNKEKSIGKKRQDLLNRANGEFVVGIDSDDWIADDYIERIINAINYSPDIDHVGFYERCNIDGVISKSIFSIRHKRWQEKADGYDHIRCANPKSVIRTEKAKKVGFCGLRYGEDRIFSETVTAILDKEYFIDKELYYYNYVSSDYNHRYGIK